MAVVIDLFLIMQIPVREKMRKNSEIFFAPLLLFSIFLVFGMISRYLDCRQQHLCAEYLPQDSIEYIECTSPGIDRIYMCSLQNVNAYEFFL